MVNTRMSFPTGNKNYETIINYSPSSNSKGITRSNKFVVGDGDDQVNPSFYQHIVNILYDSAMLSGKAFSHKNQDQWLKDPNIILNNNPVFGITIDQMKGYAEKDGKLTKAELDLLFLLKSDPAGLATSKLSFQETNSNYGFQPKFGFNENGEQIIVWRRDGEHVSSKYLIGQHLPLYDVVKDSINKNQTPKPNFETEEDILYNQIMSSGATMMLFSQGADTEDYLKKLKEQEILDAKIRDILKFRTKMERISGNQELGVLKSEISGTNLKLSNIHETDLERLNNYLIDSPIF